MAVKFDFTPIEEETIQFTPFGEAEEIVEKKGPTDIERIKQQLGEYNVLTESWGGKVPLVGVSSKTGEGIDDLLELINLTSEMAELRARYTGKAQGVIIEAEHDIKVGQLATIIVRAGKLSISDNFVAGNVYGKIKAMQDYTGKRIKEALPSMPAFVYKENQ